MEFTFYQRNPQNRWMRYNRRILIEFTVTGMVFRESGTLLLLVDCPIRALAKMETLQCLNSQHQETFVVLLRFHQQEASSSHAAAGSATATGSSTSTPPLAIATCNKQHWERIIQEMCSRRVLVEEAPKLNLFDPASVDISPLGIPLPNLKNPLVQRYMMSLRFSPSFRQLVQNVETFYDQLDNTNISTTTNSNNNMRSDEERQQKKDPDK